MIHVEQFLVYYVTIGILVNMKLQTTKHSSNGGTTFCPFSVTKANSHRPNTSSVRFKADYFASASFSDKWTDNIKSEYTCKNPASSILSSMAYFCRSVPVSPDCEDDNVLIYESSSKWLHAISKSTTFPSPRGKV